MVRRNHQLKEVKRLCVDLYSRRERYTNQRRLAMNIVSMKDVPKNPRIRPLFTGKEVTDQPLIPAGGDYNM